MSDSHSFRKPPLTRKGLLFCVQLLVMSPLLSLALFCPFWSAGGTASEASQKLYVRLFSRKLAWLSTSKIKYPEIAQDLVPCLEELTTAGLLSSGTMLMVMMRRRRVVVVVVMMFWWHCHCSASVMMDDDDGDGGSGVLVKLSLLGFCYDGWRWWWWW